MVETVDFDMFRVALYHSVTAFFHTSCCKAMVINVVISKELSTRSWVGLVRTPGSLKNIIVFPSL
jgi:hypothetical protein